ncbi:hypothetical protein [Pedobacter sp. BMA]|uniref:hypothetical protein n=1 Tax=Pedobacter sp. BMA TaxID=1663685 RepID=UPI0012E09A31|nr:hypothetical protein [Pedobacter sp. BMA]
MNRFWISLVFGTVIASLLIEYLHITHQWLDNWCAWGRNKWRIVVQLFFGLLIPIVIDITLVWIYLTLFKNTVKGSGFMVKVLPWSALLFLLGNVAYSIRWIWIMNYRSGLKAAELRRLEEDALQKAKEEDDLLKARNEEERLRAAELAKIKSEKEEALLDAELMAEMLTAKEVALQQAREKEKLLKMKKEAERLRAKELEVKLEETEKKLLETKQLAELPKTTEERPAEETEYVYWEKIPCSLGDKGFEESIEEIQCIAAGKDYATIYTKAGHHRNFKATGNVLRENLDPSIFIEVRKGAFYRIDTIESIKGYKLILKPGITRVDNILIAREYKKKVKDYFTPQYYHKHNRRK